MMKMSEGSCSFFIYIWRGTGLYILLKSHKARVKKKQQSCTFTFCELHLPSSKMSPRMKTISGLRSHSAVWKALSICHSLNNNTTVSLSGGSSATQNKRRLTSAACQTSAPRRPPGGECRTAPWLAQLQSPPRRDRPCRSPRGHGSPRARNT